MNFDYQYWMDVWWVESILAALAGLLVYFVKTQVVAQLDKRASATRNLFDDAVVLALPAPLGWGILFTTAWVIITNLSSHFESIKLPSQQNTFVVVYSALFCWFVLSLIRIRENQILKGDVETKADVTTISGIFKVLRLIVIVLTLLVVFQTLGVSISGLVAFGGVGGAAVAFASRDLLANFFGALMVFLDKPFSVGDWVRSPDREIEGAIENIGWRITKIRTFDLRPLYVPNAVFTQISIENPQRMMHRRIYEKVGIRYEDFEQMAKICSDVETMLKEHEEINEQQTLMVNFNLFAASSLEFFIYCFTHTTKWTDYHKIKQDVLLKVGQIILDNGAQIAFPTHTVHMANPELAGLEQDAPK
ncbi:mechanosensitive ion channel family protein [Bermanella sp. R86510]|uniref:mechanosensitive ion channel family protein n=1 Tax=unclassified Bermanella TaxID=2627862 RepID=UPI0037CBB0A7